MTPTRIIDKCLCPIDASSEEGSRPHPIGCELYTISGRYDAAKGRISTPHLDRIWTRCELQRVILGLVCALVLPCIIGQVERSDPNGLHYELLDEFRILHLGYLLYDAAKEHIANI